jgi:CRP/FNR family transcriptional regulator, cyclic AMP receptor protein
MHAMFRRSPVNEDLVKVPLFVGLSARELQLVARLSTEVRVPAGHVLTQQGDTGAEFFVVLDGDVDVVRQGEVIATRGAGSHLGEIALLGARPRTATLVATTPVHTRVASQREFADLITAVPALRERLEASMSERLAA